MNLLRQVIAGAGRRRVSFDADAADYFARIVTAGSTISEPNKTAVNAFVVGCKADGIWTAIKASCILAGADTLAGALVPLVGTAPTNNGPFVAGDYSRTTGLKGDGTSKYLDSNRNNNADPQNDSSYCAYISFQGVANRSLMGRGVNASGSTSLTGAFSRSNSSSSGGSALPLSGFFGSSRSGSSDFTVRSSGSDTTVSAVSQVPLAGNMLVFTRSANDGTVTTFSEARMQFYSIGESLDLAQLDARLATLMGALT